MSVFFITGWFAVAQAQTTDYSNLNNVTIPDGSPSGGCITPLNRTIVISDSYIMSDVDVGFVIYHLYPEDLTISLTSPASKTVELVNGIRTGGNGTDYNVRFNDEATAYTVESIDQNDSSPYFDSESTLGDPVPATTLSTFDGDNVNGTWTLTLCDDFTDSSPGDEGTLDEFHLHVTQSAAADPLITFLNEDFDDDVCRTRPAGWTRLDGYIDEISSTIDTAPCATSIRAPSRWYETPALNLSGQTDVELSFFLDVDTDAGEEFYVQYQTSGGSWVTFGTWTNATQDARVSAMLPAGALYNGVNLRFLTSSNWETSGDIAYIDTVTVQTSTDPLVVTITADTNTIGTLRFAINHANANTSDDNITFNIEGAGPHTIGPLSALPTITDDGISIDGTTQSGASCGDLWAGTAPVINVQINDGAAVVNGLEVTGTDILIRGLSITGFTTGIDETETSTNANYHCNFLGLAPDGTSIANFNGIRLKGNSVTVGGLSAGEGNVISGNTNGVMTSGQTDNATIQGNFIGTDPTGMIARPNTLAGLGNTSGVATVNEIRNNLISGNRLGIVFQGSDTWTGVGGADLVIAGNSIGTDRTGNAALPNTEDGINFTQGSVSDLVIGGTTAADRNVISGNGERGIEIENQTGITLLGNYIGLASDGATALPNGQHGISTTTSNNLTIGGTSAGARNIISGNIGSAIDLSGVSNVTILGNYVGTDVTGFNGLGNGGASSSATLYVVDVTDINIGNGTAAGRNIISDGTGRAIQSTGTATNLAINDNYIGTDITGSTAMKNGTGSSLTTGDVFLIASVNNLDILNNVIGPYDSEGIEFWSGSVSDDIVIQGNSFGVGADGITPFASGRSAHGHILLGNGYTATNVRIGGTGVGEGNVLANAVNAGISINTTGGFTGEIVGNEIYDNGADGIVIRNTASVAIYQNAIYNNGGLGIDLIGAGGVTDNDPGDGDTGPNDLLNFPDLTTVTAGGTDNMEVAFDADLPTGDYRIEFFKNDTPDASGHGEARYFLGFASITHGGSGSESFTATISSMPVTVSVGDSITATTTTDLGGGSYGVTSELAANITATSALVVTNTNDSGAGSLRAAIDFANANTAEDNITFAIDGAGPHTIKLTSALPAIADEGITIDGSTQTGATCGTLVTGTQHDLQIVLDGGGTLDERGLDITAANVTVRGLSIGGFGQAGLSTEGASTLAECLYVGVEPDGLTTNANLWTGTQVAVRASDAANVIFRNMLVSGHTTANNDGIRVGGTSSNALVQGNIVGLDASGTIDLGNADAGIIVSTSTGINTTIGGTTAATRNIISGNDTHGIRIRDGATGVEILGNYIGTNRDGTAGLGNGHNGIWFDDDNSSGSVGDGTQAGANLIAYNGRDGILASDLSVAAILGNSIHSNTGLGIDLINNGVTDNDTNDSDTGPNDLLNFPELKFMVANGTTTLEYDFELDVPGNAAGYRVEFFKNSAPDATNGEGEVYLGHVETGNHGGGLVNYTGTLITNVAVNIGESLSATATRMTGPGAYDITSEFSINYVAEDALTPPSINVTKTVAPLNAGDYAIPGNDVVYTFTVRNEGEGSVDADSIEIIDILPPEITFHNGDYDDDGPSSDRIGFTESSTSLTFDPLLDARFSDAATKPATFADCAYTPDPGYDTDVTFICLNPKGAMAGGTPTPEFTLSFRARIN